MVSTAPVAEAKPAEEKKDSAPLMMRPPVIEDELIKDKDGVIRNPDGFYTAPTYDYVCVKVRYP